MHTHITKLFFAFIAVALLAVAVACGSNSPAPAATGPTQPAGSSASGQTAANVTPTPYAAVKKAPPGSLNLKGNFVYAQGDGSLRIEAAGSSNPHILLQVIPSQLYADTPAISPDGTQVAFSANVFAKDGTISQDIRMINTDGTNLHVVVASKNPKVTLSFPAWSPDGQALYVTQSYPVEPASEHDEIDRVSVNGGALTTVIAEGREGTLSPDGKKIVYQKINFQSYKPSLWIANSDGSGAKQIMTEGAFAAIFGMRFSPDSSSILFAASGPPNVKLPGVTAYAPEYATGDNACAVSLGFVCLAQSAEAHGLPWDMWLVNLDGSKFERLTSLGADSPVPVWSTDGKQFAFYDGTGIYIMDISTKNIYQVSTSHGYGGFDWR